MEELNNSWKKRSSGKVVSTVNHYAFYSYYLKNTLKEARVPRKEFNKFVADLTKSLMNAMIEENLEVRLTGLGKFRIRESNIEYFDKNGEFKPNNVPVDWGSTWKYWRNKYEGLSDDEILKIPNRTVIRFENDHRKGKIYKFQWDKYTSIAKNKNIYNFRATRLAKEKLGKVLKTNSNIFYYG